jgi:peptidyl-prolyl cis-trans isomerase A (cyclophilin A)
MRNVLVVLLVSCLASAQASKPVTKAGTSHKPTSTATNTEATKNPTAVIDTTAGKLTCTLFKDKVPDAVNNFVGLANGTKAWTDPKTGQKVHGKPLYDGTIFHRVIPEFMIQGGDPQGTGMGDPGYKINDEFSPDLNFNQPGMLAYANSGPNTNGSQFFVTEIPTPFLNPCLDPNGCTLQNGRRVPKGYGYTIFGQCDQPSIDLVKQIARMPRGANDMPNSPVKINHISVTGAGAAKSATKPAIKKPATTKTHVKKPGESAPPKQ